MNKLGKAAKCHKVNEKKMADTSLVLAGELRRIKERDKRLADKLDEMRKRLERECYWCGDCQIEIAVGDTEELHKEALAGHQVVRISVFRGWQIHVLNNAVVELAPEPQKKRKV